MHLAESLELVPGEAAALDERLDVPPHEPRLEHLVAGGHRRVRREDRGRAQALERGVAVDSFFLDELAQPLELEERGVALVHVEHRRLEPELAQHADAADAEHQLLSQPVLPVAAVQRVRHFARPVRIALHLRVEEVERDSADEGAPDADANRDEVAVVVREHHRRRHRHERERQPDGVVARVTLDLAVSFVQPLAEVAAEVVQPHGDEGHAQLGGGFQMVPGEYAETAGVDREALVQPELGGEVRDEEAVRVVFLRLPPAGALGLGGEPLLHPPELHRVLRRQRLGKILVRQLGEERRRVVQELAEAPPVELREELASARRPAEGEVACDLCQRGTKARPVVDLGHRAAPYRSDGWYPSVTRRDLTGSLATGLTNA